MRILNNEALDNWLFEHAQVQGHQCNSVKGVLSKDLDPVNISWKDSVTGELFDIVYETAEAKYKRQRDKLREYARHKNHCMSIDYHDPISHSCTCGLDETIEEIKNDN